MSTELGSHSKGNGLENSLGVNQWLHYVEGGLEMQTGLAAGDRSTQPAKHF